MTPAEIAAARALADTEEVPFNRLTDLGQALRQRDEAMARLARACELLKQAIDRRRRIAQTEGEAMTRPKQTKRYDYIGAVYGGVQSDMRGDDLQQSVKRVLRRLVREAVMEIAHADGSRTFKQLRDHIARKLVP
jgi:hypothetical protein